MASTTTNGVVLKKPFGIVRSIQRTRPFTLSIIGPDPLHSNQTTLREFPATVDRDSNGFFVYVGDKIIFTLQAPCLDPTAKAFDIISVHQSTGVESAQASIYFNRAWETQLTVTVSAMHATTGVWTYTVAYA